jgi:hypothetical protein
LIKKWSALMRAPILNCGVSHRNPFCVGFLGLNLDDKNLVGCQRRSDQKYLARTN